MIAALGATNITAIFALLVQTLVQKHQMYLSTYRTGIVYLCSDSAQNYLQNELVSATYATHLPLLIVNDKTSANTLNNERNINIIALCSSNTTAATASTLFKSIQSRDVTLIFLLFTSQDILDYASFPVQSLVPHIQHRAKIYVAQLTKFPMVLSNGQFQRNSIESIKHGNYSSISESSVSFYRAHFKVFFSYLPPTTAIYPHQNSERLTYMGFDSFMISILLQRFNMTAYTATDVDRASLDGIFFGFGRLSVVRAFHKRAFIDNYVSDLGVNYNHTNFDMYLESFYMQPQTYKQNRTVDYLYPYCFECLVAIFPKNHERTSMIWRVIRNGEVQTIVIVYLVFVFVQFLISGSKTNIGTAWFRTIGMCLAQMTFSDMTANRLQFLWTVGLLVFSVTSPVVLAGVLYRSLVVAETVANIDTLDELVQMNKTIYNVDSVGDKGAWLNTLNTNFSRLMQVVSLTELVPILFGGKGIIVVQESKQYTLEIWLHSLINVPKEHQFYHIVKEKVYCGLMANRIVINSPLESYINRLRLDLVESGIFQIYTSWNDRFFSAMSPALNSAAQQRSHEALTMNQLGAVFRLYLIGMAVNLLVFVFECLWNLVKRFNSVNPLKV